MRIQVYKCRFTKKLFEKRGLFIRHLKKLRKEQRARREAKRFRLARIAFFANMRETVESFEDLEKFIIKNWKHFEENAVLNSWGVKVKGQKRFPVKKVKFVNIYWSNSVSNSHRCPIGGTTNWGGRKEGAPRGYPGWSARLEYEFDIPNGQSSSFPRGSELFENTCINTGTGGGGGSTYGYHVEIFASDWPGLAKSKAWEILSKCPRD